jgi:hypothetical protein
MDMTDGVAFGDGPAFQCYVVVARTSTVVLLGYEVQGGRPGTL